MSDPRYEYQRVNVVKVVLQSRRSGKVLLLQEPETNEWMPLHWGLPGGKPLEKESLQEAFGRKMDEELGLKLKPEGILAIEELLIEGRTVYMYILLAYVDSEEKVIKEGNFKWVERDGLERMTESEFTEFYSKRLLTDFFEGNLRPIPLDLIRTERYFELGNDSAYKEWFDSGRKPERRK